MAPKRQTLSPVLLVVLALTGCGGDDGSSDADRPPAADASSDASEQPTDEPTESPEEDVPDEAAAEETIKAWFEAARTGDTETICALLTEDYQVLQYGSTAGCAEDLANQRPQAVWAEDVPVTSVSVSETSGTAEATVTPNAGDTVTEATVGLVAVDGAWLIDSLR